MRLGAAAEVAADDAPPPALLSLAAGPALPRWLGLAGGAVVAAAALSAARPGPPPIGGQFVVESTTVVTQRATDENGDAVLRVQRRRASRSSEQPQNRVTMDTVVRRTSKDPDGNIIKTTTRDRAVNPPMDDSPRAISAAEMDRLLRPDRGLLPPAAGT